MGEFSAVECDYCKKVGKKDQGLKPPANWITTQIHKVADRGELKTLHCSAKCAIKALQNREKISKQLRELTPEEFHAAHCDSSDDVEYPTHHESCSMVKPW